MKKKLLLVLSLVAITTVFLAISVSAADPIRTWAASYDDSVTAYLYADPENEGMYTLTISGTGYMKNWNSNGAPWYSGYGSKITSVTIENGVTNISLNAFNNCTSLTSIEIPSSVMSINYAAFLGCTSLTSIEIPSSVTSIDASAFNSCTSLTSVVIPDSVTNIGQSVFYNCTSLTSVVIPGSITNIGHSVFYNCTSLTSVVIPDSITNIGQSAFHNCTSLTSIEIPSSVTSIGDHAFYGCKRLTSVVIENGVTSIGEETFYGCTSLTSIEIPSSVMSIGDGAFGFCKSLTSIIVNDGNMSYESENGNLYSYTNDEKILIQYAIGKTNVCFVIPNGVTSIGKSAFASCAGLTSIEIPSSVTSIDGNAFYNCSSLRSITFEEESRLTSIGDSAFSKCTSLTSVKIPSSVTSIGKSAFDYCWYLTIYCEAESQPSGWASTWNSSNRPVVWGYFDEEACLEKVFTFKGYSFGFAGQISVGFDIDYEAMAKYEEKTGKTLEIGVVFAGYDNLGGSQPLDENGQPIALSVGRVSKGDLTGFGYPSYDFVLTDIVDSIKDVKLVIAAYIYNGESVKYVQENGLSDTVIGVSYNEAKGEETVIIEARDEDPIYASSVDIHIDTSPLL